MLSLSAVDRVCEYRLETTAELIAVGLLESGRPGRAVNAKRGVPHSLAPIREKVPDLRDLCRALLRTRTADLLLTMNVRRGSIHAGFRVVARDSACRWPAKMVASCVSVRLWWSPPT